jgi:pectate lyase
MHYHLLKKLQLAASVLAISAFGHSAYAIDAAQQIAPSDGWASQAGGTLGGSAAGTSAIFTVSNRAQLLAALANGGSAAKIVKIVGIIDMSEGVAFSSHSDQATRAAITVPANTTLIGDAANAGIVNGYVNISGTSQVIIRNLQIVAPCDVTPVWDATSGSWASVFPAIQISASHHVWIDHNTFTDSPITNDTLAIENGAVKECHDGALDIKNASDYVTVSYNLFSLHGKNNTIGASDTASGDEGHLTVTFSNNVFSNVTMRTPRVRYGQVHLFNNYYTGSKNHPVYPHNYSVGAGIAAKILSNNNVFEITGATTCDDVVTNPNSSTAAGAFKDAGSTLNGAALSGCLLSNSVTWAAPYSFAAKPITFVKASVLSQSGSGKLTTTITGTGSTSSSSSSVASSVSSSSSSSSAAAYNSVWTEQFSAASTAAFFTTAYATQTNGNALYQQLNGTSNITANGSTLVLNGNRFAVGATATTASTSTSAPAGVFDLAGRACTLTLNVAAASGAGKMFQVSINNNTTSSGNSPLGTASRVVNADVSTLVVGANSWNWSNVGSSTSFLMFRTESGASVTMDSATLACSGGTPASSSSSSAAPSSSSSSSSSVAPSSSSSSSVFASSSSSSAVTTSSSSSSSNSTSGGPVAIASGGFATTQGGNIAGARYKTATSFEEMNAIIAAARINDAGKKVTSGAYPLVIAYTGNEDDKIAQIVADHTIDANHNCPKPHWNDPFREVSLKDFTAGVTIIGANGSSANFGITIVGSGNVVIRNMKIGALAGANNDADMIRIDDSPNVWIDHNELFAVNNECNGSPDGDLTFESAIDIKKGSHNITVSYNYIHDSKKVGLDGSSAGDIEGGREITYHHNVYYNVNGRLPLQRGGWTHIYNNTYDKITSSGINVRSGGYSLIENNWFQNSLNPVTCRYDVDNCGKWELRNNNATSSADNAKYNITWNIAEKGDVNADNWTTTAAFPITLPYTYAAESAECVKANLASVAGVGKGLATLKCN